MVSFGKNIVVITASLLALLLHNEVSALSSNNNAPRFSPSELQQLSQGEASLFGSSTPYMYCGQPLWSGNKNKSNTSKKTTTTPGRSNNNEDRQSLSKFTPRTKANHSSFVQKNKLSWLKLNWNYYIPCVLLLFGYTVYDTQHMRPLSCVLHTANRNYFPSYTFFSQH